MGYARPFAECCITSALEFEPRPYGTVERLFDMVALKRRLFIFDTYSMESWKICRRGNKYFAPKAPCKTTIYGKAIYIYIYIYIG